MDFVLMLNHTLTTWSDECILWIIHNVGCVSNDFKLEESHFNSHFHHSFLIGDSFKTGIIRRGLKCAEDDLLKMECNFKEKKVEIYRIDKKWSFLT